MDNINFKFISLFLGSCVINTILSHILYSRKLRKELKNKGNDMISENIQMSLQYARDMELEIKTQEIYEIDNLLSEKGSNLNIIEGEKIYPAILNDFKSLNNFYNQIQICRKEYEKNLPCNIALNIVFIDRYMCKLMLFLSEYGGEKYIKFWGTIFIYDLQNWQRKIDKMIIKEINKHNYKLESHETHKWKKLRKRILVRQYNNTILNKLITCQSNCKNKEISKLKKIAEDLKNLK